jgi:hypothetical protein
MSLRSLVFWDALFWLPFVFGTVRIWRASLSGCFSFGSHLVWVAFRSARIAFGWPLFWVACLVARISFGSPVIGVASLCDRLSFGRLFFWLYYYSFGRISFGTHCFWLPSPFDRLFVCCALSPLILRGPTRLSRFSFAVLVFWARYSFGALLFRLASHLGRFSFGLLLCRHALLLAAFSTCSLVFWLPSLLDSL